MHTSYNEDKKFLRRNLRRNGTPAEGRLWLMLKNNQVGGLHFRRQVDIGNHIVDFYCHELHLAIELDGDYHYHGLRPDMDYDRDADLENNYNVRTLRFENKLVFEQPQAIINSILHEKELILQNKYPPAQVVPLSHSVTAPLQGEQRYADEA